MAQSDQDWVKEYGSGGMTVPNVPTPKKPKKKDEDEEEQASTLTKARRAIPSGNYPRPRLGGLTVGS